VGTAALGATAIIAAGGIDLSVGSNIALVTVVVARLLERGVPPAIAAMGGIAASVVCGLVIGLLITQLRLAPFIVTLGMWGALRGAAKWIADQTNVLAPTTWLNEIMRTLRPSQAWMIFPPAVWLMFLLTILTGGVFRYTRFGRHIFAVGSNEHTARLCGVSVERSKLFTYIFATIFAGMAGVMQFSWLTIGDPTTANGYELNIIAAVVIGGTSLTGGSGGVFGTLLGALIMTIIANGCTKVGMSNPVQEMVTGGIIIFAVVLDHLRKRTSV
jgi:ribose/xylose/arabinose/galactoside ABC-type transport system permease subunit